MRFNEKSFELRFCAALSAAAMPFNRNPQWFGMTQAQERKNGVDAMIKTGGGSLLIFQFKAQNKNTCCFDKSQWFNLSRVEGLFPRSTLYVLPGVGDISSAARISCLLKESWLVRPADLGPAFRSGAQTTSLCLDPASNTLRRSRPSSSVPAKRLCGTLGCFCRPWGKRFRSDLVRSWLQFRTALGDFDEQTTAFEDAIYSSGVPICGFGGRRADRDAIETSAQFESLFSEDGRPATVPNLMGLFLPYAQKEKGR